MIRQLRRKLIGITWVLLSAVLVVILVLVYNLTANGLYEDSLAVLRASENDLFEGKHFSDRGPTISSPCFILQWEHDGALEAWGSSMYDLSDLTELEKLLFAAQATGRNVGTLDDYQLRYMSLEDGPVTRYAFVDISAEMETLERLNYTCCVILVLGCLGFYGICVLFAKRAIQPVEQAFTQQRQFVADASHELKTPLTVILTNAELLKDPSYDEDSRRQFSDNILTMSRQMRGLVEELLNQARVDGASVIYQRLDLSQLAQETALIFEPLYFEAERALETEIQSGLHVNGNEEQLRRVMEILLDNGCKYSTRLSPVALRLKKHGKHCLLSVTSPGIPLTDQQCQDIFKRFYRVDAVRTMSGSYGLGLPIARTIVGQHHGQIWAQSHDQWNTFFVQLPLC